MTRTDLLEKICYTDYTNDCSACDGRYNCQDCKDAINPLLDEYDKQIRADAIEELGKALCDELDKGYIFINKHQILHFVKQLKNGDANTIICMVQDFNKEFLRRKNMARTYTVTEYTKEDLEALDDMPLVDVVQALSEIKRDWMPQGYYGISNDEFKTYDEDYYDIARLHKAITKAIDIVAQYELLRSEGKIE